MSKVYLVYDNNLTDLPKFVCDDRNTASEASDLINGYVSEMTLISDIDDIVKAKALAKLTYEEKRVLGLV